MVYTNHLYNSGMSLHLHTNCVTINSRNGQHNMDFRDVITMLDGF